jgi:hypothetical protein
MNGELQNISALDQLLRRIDQVLGLTNQLVPRATDSGVGTDCEVEGHRDIEHSEEAANLKKRHLKKRMFGLERGTRYKLCPQRVYK